MIPINVLLQRAQYMSIEDLEKHMREREAEVKRLRAEQGALKLYWDRAWAKRIAATSGPANLSQTVDFKLEV